ncbi:MAG: HNH endonuclease [Clostridiales bacterium]|nr:HNH endonuclease [Clostridiales bacterium]
MIVEDCRGKCYLCEDSVHTAPNVEHRISHENDAALKYDWNNLLLACYHCNNTKLDKYNGIIDPTKVDPEALIDLSLDLDEELREKVIVRKISGGRDTDITIDLLNAVYNGQNTDMKKYSCQQLKNKLSNELSWFRQKLEAYRANPNDANEAVIRQEISDTAIFAAFKRGIIKTVFHALPLS